MLLGLLLSLSLMQAAVTGTVKDTSGGAVSGASVVVQTESGGDQQTVTGADGRFTLDNPPESGTLIVRAGGFAEQRQPLTRGDIEVVLSPATLLETVTVTPTRSEQRLGDVPASVSVLTSEDIRRSPATIADDVLRQIPTFSLFRRTSSLSSHPTAQGVSLRGIGPSGVSRSLVLVDGTPFNDPFGGWVYWTRVPLEDTDRIEIVDGSSSSLYGNYAMGGVINIVGNRPARRTVDMKAQYGNKTSPKADFFGSDLWGKLGVSLGANVFDTDGFPIVVPEERGIIDNNATVKFSNVNLKLDYSPSGRFQTFFRTGFFKEDRGNGKIGEVNDTRWNSASGGVRVQLPDNSNLQATVFTDFEKFHSTFLAVTPPSATVAPRSIVRLTVDQNVPTDSVGSMVQWSKVLSASNYLSAGLDWRWVDGDSNENVYNPAPGPVTPPVQQAVLALQRVSGGTQRSVGAYVQDVLTPLPKLTVTLSARVDSWRNYDAHNLETAVIPGTPTNNKPSLPDRDDTVVSPRAGARYQVSDKVSAWGSFGAGFRAPTLNELYRQFRVGTTLVLANDQLGPERLVGGEAGVNLSLARNFTVRTTWYDNRIDNPVANVTLSIAPGTTTQQRQNLGATRVWGIQTDAEYRMGSYWRLAGGYLFNQAKVEEFQQNPALNLPSIVGNYLPQVPKNRGSMQLSYANPKYLTLALGLQAVGAQYDDDQNTPSRLLPEYAVLDATVSRTIGSNFDVFFGVQNMFDQQYIVGTLPTTSGSPRLVSGGVRFRFAAR